jgi:hypothetical protein
MGELQLHGMNAVNAAFLMKGFATSWPAAPPGRDVAFGNYWIECQLVAKPYWQFAIQCRGIGGRGCARSREFMPEPAADWFFNNRGSYSSTLGGLAGKLTLPKDLSHARINAPAPAPTLITVSNVN